MPEKEPMFRFLVRTFLKTLCVMIAIFVGLIPFFILSAVKKEHGPEKKNVLVYDYDLKGNNSIQPISSPVVLRINIEGEIGKMNMKSSIVQDQLYESRQGVLKNNRVKAILLYINTPGGCTYNSGAIYRLIKAYKETYQVPVFAYSEGMIASGGMHIACAADKINAEQSTIVGSIGVIASTFFNIKDTLNDWKIKTKTLSAGKGKDDMSPFKTWQPDEDKNLKDIIAGLYEEFVSLFLQARTKVTRNQLVNEYGASVFLAKKAEEIGYIDNGNSSYEETLRELLAVAKIDENKPYQVVMMKPKFSFFSAFFSKENSMLQGKMHHVLHLGKETGEESFPFLYKYEP
jgi:protease-4